MCKKSHFAHGWQLLPYLDGLETCGWLTKGNHSLLVHATHRYVSAMHLRADWVQANLGGSPTRLDWTKAFLRVKEKDRGPLDFDVPGGADTTWQRVYLCLRSGYDTEAIEVLIISPQKNSPSLLIIWRSWLYKVYMTYSRTRLYMMCADLCGQKAIHSLGRNGGGCLVPTQCSV